MPRRLSPAVRAPLSEGWTASRAPSGEKVGTASQGAAKLSPAQPVGTREGGSPAPSAQLLSACKAARGWQSPLARALTGAGHGGGGLQAAPQRDWGRRQIWAWSAVKAQAGSFRGLAVWL